LHAPDKEIFMKLWSVSNIGKRVTLLGFLAVSVWLLTGTQANGQAATSPATSTAPTKATIQAAQKRLLALGYQCGAADGVMGARAIAALKKFQADHILPVTGQLDRKTLDALNAEGKKAPSVSTKRDKDAVAVEKYEPSPKTAAQSAPKPALSEQAGCLCNFDEAKKQLSLIPWDKEDKKWNFDHPLEFNYEDSTTFEANGKATIEEIRNGKPLKSAHFHGMSFDGSSVSFDTTPFEITTLSGCIGRLAEVYWDRQDGTPLARRIELPYLLGGMSMAGMGGNDGAQSAYNADDNCPCK
jgi:hypothetical protein